MPPVIAGGAAVQRAEDGAAGLCTGDKVIGFRGDDPVDLAAACRNHDFQLLAFGGGGHAVTVEINAPDTAKCNARFLS